jgi:hypothetical protein
MRYKVLTSRSTLYGTSAQGSSGEGAIMPDEPDVIYVSGNDWIGRFSRDELEAVGNCSCDRWYVFSLGNRTDYFREADSEHMYLAANDGTNHKDVSVVMTRNRAAIAAENYKNAGWTQVDHKCDLTVRIEEAVERGLREGSLR